MALNFKSSCCNLKIWEQKCVWLFLYFNFERNHKVLKSQESVLFVEQKFKLNKNKTESRMENLTHSFIETNLVLQLIKELQIKSKTVMSWTLQKKRGHLSHHLFCLKENFLHLCFISMYSVLKTLSEFKYFYKSKNIASYTFLLF